MVTDKNRKKFIEFRNTYQNFIFEKFSYNLTEESFDIIYTFSLDGKYDFYPEIKIPLRKFYKIDVLPAALLDNLVFHIGMVELVSYWKAACPKKVIIKPFKLNKEQVDWWKKLYFNGLGEFFYLNDIETDQVSFMEIISVGKELPGLIDYNASDAYMVPVGGGKDSVVSLELLRSRFQVVPMVINPRKATNECIAAAGFTREESIIIHRSIHPQLLKLNAEGFLNGHTPFSAMLAFTSVLVAALAGIKNIALSNEASANETTVKGLNINHQYSKSYEFEVDFRFYVSRYLTPSVNYFSFLRPLHEIQIAKLFAGFPKYFPVFKSCNVGSKTDTWCCSCPKCLFAYIIIAPHVDYDELIRIFGEDLLDKPYLKVAFDELTGKHDVKPFECIGTVEEVNVALCRIIKNCKVIPALLKTYVETKEYSLYKDYDMGEMMNRLETEHFLNPVEFEIIKKSLHD